MPVSQLKRVAHRLASLAQDNPEQISLFVSQRSGGMRRRIDLHMHTTHSDGTLTPTELVARARSKELSCIALTDHDTVSGIKEAQRAGNEHDVEVIPGVEISVIFEPGTMHILGYFVDIENKDLLKGLESVQEARRHRNPKIIERLNALGFAITLEEVEKVSGGDQIGRPHFAKVMVEKGFVKSHEEAFKKYLGRGCSAYIDKRTVTSKDAIQMIREAGGVASLAHPKQLKVPQGDVF
ncbi:MAG: PHP domain-containing protein, partial [Candidatus Omnitrophica bacterium]|nr:PHP domain-containing protein [Candidatus Omnitrophota bacterium]